MNSADKISKFLNYGEATFSQTAVHKGIPNIPNEVQLAAMRYVATEVFDKVREKFGPMSPTSFFRSPELNKAIGGSSTTSQHMKGEAIDIVKHGKNKEIFDFIRHNLVFDQLIFERGTDIEPDWVHVSRVPKGNRHQVLQCTAPGVYKIFDLYP